MEKSKIVSVCIDDFALKKRQRYGTVMVNLETHKIVDMIESREPDDVRRWLCEYPNISVVSRDGSQTYAAAITAAHPKAAQISDRFHLVKNLAERATNVFQTLFQGRIGIPVTSETQRIRMEMFTGNKVERALMVKRLRKAGRSKNEICALIGVSLKTLNRYLNVPDNVISEEKQTARGREHEMAVEKLRERAERVLFMYENGCSLATISQSTGFTYGTVKNYLSENFSPINAHYGKQREGKLEPFRAEVMQMRLEGITYREIHQKLKEKGYLGTQDAIRGFMSKEQRIQRDLQSITDGDPQEYIDKKWLIRLLYKPLESVKGITKAQLSAIFKLYPLVESILRLVTEFKAVLKSKQPHRLLAWMEEAELLNVTELNRFLTGLKSDIDAVLNAVEHAFSNGLAEGSVNKIKVIKRVMYGRCSFDLLKAKCILGQSWE